MNPYYRFLGQEDKDHISITEYVNKAFPRAIWTHIPNEGRRSKFERFKISLMGVRKGASDFLFFDPRNGYNGLAIEQKVVYANNQRSYMSKHQKKFLEDLKNCNWLTLASWTVENTISIINQYYKEDGTCLDIFDKACKIANISKTEAKSKSQKHQAVLARNITIWYYNKILNKTQEESGAFFNKDRTTAWHAIQAVNNYIETDKCFKNKIERLLNGDDIG